LKPIEKFFEAVLWNSRWLMVVPVLISLVLAIGVLIVTTVDALSLVGDMIGYAGQNEETRSSLYVQTISEVVSVVDGYLLAAIMLIFSLGLYELFINKIDAAEGSEVASRLLLIRSLDDLKNRLANVIIVILIVKFFQQALGLKYTYPLDLLYLAIGVVLIAAALYLSGRAKPAKLTSPSGKSE
jgi:uncharacterized membrane protein YqhA